MAVGVSVAVAVAGVVTVAVSEGFNDFIATIRTQCVPHIEKFSGLPYEAS